MKKLYIRVQRRTKECEEGRCEECAQKDKTTWRLMPAKYRCRCGYHKRKRTLSTVANEPTAPLPPPPASNLLANRKYMRKVVAHSLLKDVVKKK